MCPHLRVEAWKPPKQELVELLDRVADAYVQATRLKASAPVLFAGFQHPVPGPARLPKRVTCRRLFTAPMAQHWRTRHKVRQQVGIGYILGNFASCILWRATHGNFEAS